MLRFISFGSGSCGNCYYIFTEKVGILIDVGIGVRKLKKYFIDYGLSFSKVSYVLLTHDHADHVKAVGSLCNTYELPVYTTRKAHDGIISNYRVRKKIEGKYIRTIEKGETKEFEDVIVTAFHVPHDSAENVGYKITHGDVTFCLMTDIGHVTEDITKAIGEANYLVIEANHDEEMLLAGPYPEYLKRRVLGERGHLSNKTCAETLREHASTKLNHVWLCHLSQENNHPELARKTVETELMTSPNIIGRNVKVEVLKRNTPSNVYTLV